MPKLLRLFALALIASIAACSGGASNSRLDYKEAGSLHTLDMPPDLVAPVNTGDTELPAMGASGGAGEILPQTAGIRVLRDGGDHWLELSTPVEELWPRLRTFWASLGLEVAVDEPELGILETAWAENRADAPGGFLTKWVKAVFKDAYSAGTRDKYRLRLERGESGGSEIYISHYGLKEVALATRDELDVGNLRWEVRPSDQELVVEVLKRLVNYLGGSEQLVASAEQVAVVVRARIEGDMLVIDEGFARSWRRTGIALDRLGVVVEDRNRARGIYYVVEVDLLPREKKGWLGSIFSSDEKPEEQQPQLQVVLQGDETVTRLRLLNMDGTPSQDEMATELLKRLQQELK